MDFLHRLIIRKDTHKYAIELLKAEKKMPVDVAERLPHQRKIKSYYQKRFLKNRTNQLLNLA